jgi:hypothetical protein
MTSAVRARATAEVWARRAATGALILLTALAIGVLLVGVAASRRGTSAMDRFLAYYRSPDATVRSLRFDLPLPVEDAAVRRLPNVLDVEKTAFVPMIPVGRATGSTKDLTLVYPLVHFHNRAGTTMARPIIVAGRPPDPRDPAAVRIGERLAAQWHLGPGSTLVVRAFAPAQYPALHAAVTGGGPPPVPAGPVLRLRVAAVQREPSDLSPQAVSQVPLANAHVIGLTPAFGRFHGGDVAMSRRVLDVTLRHGQADVQSFAAAVRGLPGGARAEVVPGSESLDTASRVTAALRFEAASFLILGLATGLGGLLLVGQGLDRETQWFRPEHETLRALGMTRVQLTGITAIRSAVVVFPGALLAIPVAVLGSAFFPIGLARRAEVSPGPWFDVPVLGLGATAAVLLLMLRATAGGILGARALRPHDRADVRPRRVRPSLAALFGTGLPLAMLTGITRAVHPGRPTRPRPTVIVALGAVGVIAVTASLVVGVNLDRLLRDPVQQGWTWDAAVGYLPEPGFADRALRTLRDDPSVAATALYGEAGAVAVQGRDVPALVLGQDRGRITPRVVSGRAPSAADEVALGHDTARRLGARLGDEVSIVANGSRRRYRVVGLTVMWTAMSVGTKMGTGVLFTPAGARPLLPQWSEAAQVLVRFAPGVPHDEGFRHLRRDFHDQVLGYSPADDVQNVDRVRRLPFAVAGVFAALGLLGVGMALVSSVRTGQDELAVLKALGVVRRQVYAVVSWQALTHGILALLVGAPLGVAAGRWVWHLLSSEVQAAVTPVEPAVSLALAGVVTLAAVAAVAAIPAISAVRTSPTPVLRAE